MSRHRQGEFGSVPFRTGRFFYIDAQWYFACREGKNCGPYDSRQQAQLALDAYIKGIQEKEPATSPPEEAGTAETPIVPTF